MVGITQKSYVTLFPLWSLKKTEVGYINLKQQEHMKSLKIEVDIVSDTDILIMLLLMMITILMIIPLLVLLLLLLTTNESNNCHNYSNNNVIIIKIIIITIKMKRACALKWKKDNESRYNTLFMVSGSIKKLFSVDYVNIYLFSIFLSIDFEIDK